MNGFQLTKEQKSELCNSIDGTVMVEGFVFIQLMTEKLYMIIHKIPEARLGGIVACSKKTLEEHICFINDNHVENLIVCAENIEFIEKCQGLRSIIVVPTAACEKNFDFSPLYRMRNLVAVDCSVEGDAGNLTTIDFTKIKGIKQINICVGNFKGATGFQVISDLEGLSLAGFEKKSLREYFCSPCLKYIDLYECSAKSLDGVEIAKELNRIEISEMTMLEDIAALECVADTLKELKIDNCRKIKDFSVLEKLVNLKHLELRGRNKLSNLNFLYNMKDLKTFVFDMDVIDGNLSQCLQVPFVYCEKNRKHYNLKNKSLPKDETYWEWGLKFKHSSEQLL